MNDAPVCPVSLRVNRPNPPLGGNPNGLAKPDPWGPLLAKSDAARAFMHFGWRAAPWSTDMGCILKGGGGLYPRLVVGAVLLAAGEAKRMGGRM